MAIQISVREESHDWSGNFLGTYYQRIREQQRLRSSVSEYAAQMVLY